MSRLVLVDAHSVLYRSFFAFIRSPLRNSRGMNTSGIFGFANTLRKVLRELKPDYCAVVFDAPGKTFRDELYSEYKAQRPKVPAELVHSVPYAKALVQAWGVKIFEIPGYEADDVIGTFARLGAEKGLEVVIVSSDKDLLQLVSRMVSVYDPYREKYYRVDDVKDKLGILPEQVPDYLALAGDAVDNIPGVPGIGPKRAQSILLKHGSLEVALQKEEKLQPYLDLALLSRRLAKIDTAAGIEVELESLIPGKPDKNRLVQLYQELEFSSLLRETDEAETPKIEVVNTVLNRTTEQFVEELHKTGIAGIAWEPERGLWVSVSGEKVVLIPVECREIIEQILQSASLIKAGFDFKEQIKILRPYRLKIVPPFFDNCIGAWLIDPNRKRFNPADIIGQILHRSVEVRTPSEQAGWAVRVYHSLIPELLARGLTSVYDSLEMPLVPVLAQMEERGVKIDVEFFRSLERDLRGELHAIESKIWQLAGRQFNISSPKQLREILFDHLKLPTGKKTKTGFSTSSEVLANLVSEHPIVAEILRYRELEKLCTTYLAPLPTMADPVSHRLHTRFNQWGTSTGRLSSSEPNLQNIPIRGELGEKIRKGFIADHGMVLISADYSQIELRVLAHFSEDEHLIAAFQNGEDIHVATASAILNIPPEQITPEHRRIAKMVNYGLIYGMGDWGLAVRMDIPREQARVFMEEYFLKFPGVARWREQLIEVAKRDGYVRTISGRMRPIPGISSEIRQQVEMALRMALNAPMQGSAADIMKSAMIRIDQRLQEMGVRGGMILQIHDELLLEVEEEKCSAVRDMVRSEMENAWQLKVPLKVDIGVGRSWGEAH
ncbi:MAG: DNA polymerase I [candidate division WOR-3 bacterium]